MIKFLIPLVLLLAACSQSERSPFIISSFSSSESSVYSAPEMKNVDLLSGFSSNAENWFQRIGAHKIQGNIEYGTITLSIQRKQGEDSGFDAIGLYVAELDANGQITSETKSTRYIDSRFVGNCKRQLKPEPYDLNTLGSRGVTKKFGLAKIPVTSEDLCESKTTTISLGRLINGNGVVIGFLPSSERVTIDASIQYDGNLSADRFRW